MTCCGGRLGLAIQIYAKRRRRWRSRSMVILDLVVNLEVKSPYPIAAFGGIVPHSIWTGCRFKPSTTRFWLAAWHRLGPQLISTRTRALSATFVVLQARSIEFCGTRGCCTGRPLMFLFLLFLTVIYARLQESDRAPATQLC